MKVVKKVLSIIAWILIGIIIIYNIYNFVSIRIFKNELPTVGGYAQLKVISGSMEPTIDIGDMIVINTKYSDYKEEDIITFKDAKGSFVTHRIIEKTEDGYVTKGDNNNSIDQGYITNDDIVGKFAFRVKFLGIILDSFQNPITMVLILIMGIILCFLISTDKDGMPKDITKEEKEFIEFLEAKRKLEKNTKKDIEKTKESNPKTNSKKSSTKKKEDKQKETAPKKKGSKTNTTSTKKKRNTTSEKDSKTTTKKATTTKKSVQKKEIQKEEAPKKETKKVSTATKKEDKQTTKSNSAKKKSSNTIKKEEPKSPEKIKTKSTTKPQKEEKQLDDSKTKSKEPIKKSPKKETELKAETVKKKAQSKKSVDKKSSTTKKTSNKKTK